MKKIRSLIIVSLLLTGCDYNLKVSEVGVKKVNRNMQEIINDVAAENGNYLIEGKKES